MGDVMSGAARAAVLMTLAQRGRHDEATDVATAALAEPGTTREERIALSYALACAHFFAGRPADAERAADACAADATAAGDAGWRANALAVRATVREIRGSSDAALDDAIESEVLLSGCTDAGLRNWCFSGLGSFYTTLRLFELALPHYTAAIETPEQALPYADGVIVDHFNLADLHLRWSRELERVGLDDPDRRAEHTQHLAEAQRWVDSGAALLAHGGDASDWVTAFDRMRAQAASVTDPAQALDELERVRRLDAEELRHDDAVQSTSALARAHRLLGRLDEAQAIAAEAVEMLAHGPDNEHTTTLDAHFQLHMAQLAAGVPGSEGAAGYVRLSTQLLWEQRTRSVEGVRARRDYAVLARDHAESRRMAREDQLTALANRRAIDEWLHEHTVGPAALVLIDLDGFKSINDSHGHAIGDVVLMRVAGALRTAARGSDLVARFGGDEFVVLVDGSGVDLEALAERIAEAISAIDLADCAPGVRASATIGTASVADQVSTHELLAEADRLLLRNKRRRAAETVA
jgi:diguanylate cyclase (GGDEF)-like protein